MGMGRENHLTQPRRLTMACCRQKLMTWDDEHGLVWDAYRQGFGFAAGVPMAYG